MRPGPRHTYILSASLLVLLSASGPVAGERIDLPDGSTIHYGTTPIDQSTMEYLLMWNPTDQGYDIYDHGTLGLTTVDDPGTRWDDRSVSHGGVTWDDSLYTYEPTASHLQFDNPSATGGFDDVKVVYPQVASLDATAAVDYAQKVAAAFLSLEANGLIALDGMSNCGPAYHSLPIGAQPGANDVWIFIGPVPDPLQVLPQRWMGVGCFLP